MQALELNSKKKKKKLMDLGTMEDQTAQQLLG